MVHMHDRHKHIVLTILQQYPYTFYAFGSRVKGTHQKLSDLDLCFFENISIQELAQLDYDFEQSDLPFKVDIVNWQTCSQTFRSLIENDFVPLQASQQLKNIEHNFFSKFLHLPHQLNCDVESDQELTQINCHLQSTMFNIVCNSHLSKKNAEQKIEETIKIFNGLPFSWWLGPTHSPDNLTQLLVNHNLKSESTEHIMACNLKQPHENVEIKNLIKQVNTPTLLNDFISVLSSYDTHAIKLYKKITTLKKNDPLKLFVGYDNNQPVVTGALYATPTCVGIFDLFVKPDHRRKGLGSRMMEQLINIAQQDRYSSVYLSASTQEAQELYTKLGFKTIGFFLCYESK